MFLNGYMNYITHDDMLTRLSIKKDLISRNTIIDIHLYNDYAHVKA